MSVASVGGGAQTAARKLKKVFNLAELTKASVALHVLMPADYFVGHLFRRTIQSLHSERTEAYSRL